MSVIGEIKTAQGMAAVLADDGQWSSEDKRLALYLNARFSPREARGVDVVMPFGLMAIQRAAAVLGAKVVSCPRSEPLPEGLVS